MSNRIELHSELIQFSANVYFQPPSDIRLKYPCIVYNKVTLAVEHANNKIYKNMQEYLITVMSTDPDYDVAEQITLHFPYASLGNVSVIEGLNQTTVTLYY